jgi:hypothetical protein
VPCPEGNYCSSPQSIANCTLGYLCKQGTIKPKRCEAGYYCEGLGTAFPCPPGSFCEEGSGVMTLCPQGYYCKDGKTKEKCAPGSLCPTGSSKESECPKGKICENDIAVECLPGHYCDGKNGATPCETGTYYNGTDASSKAFCTPCGEHKITSDKGTYDADDCKCDKGYYVLEDGVTCHQCPDGMKCDEIGISVGSLTTSPGYFTILVKQLMVKVTSTL